MCDLFSIRIFPNYLNKSIILADINKKQNRPKAKNKLHVNFAGVKFSFNIQNTATFLSLKHTLKKISKYVFVMNVFIKTKTGNKFKDKYKNAVN